MAVSFIRKLGQAALPVRDVSRAEAFYRDVLGLFHLWSNQHMAFFDCGGTRLMLEVPEKPEFDHPGSVLYFDVDSLDEAVAEYTAKGVTFVEPPHHIGDLGNVSIWMAFFRDSEGNLLALQEERPRQTP